MHKSTTKWYDLLRVSSSVLPCWTVLDNGTWIPSAVHQPQQAAWRNSNNILKRAGKIALSHTKPGPASHARLHRARHPRPSLASWPARAPGPADSREDRIRERAGKDETRLTCQHLPLRHTCTLSIRMLLRYTGIPGSQTESSASPGFRTVSVPTSWQRVE